MITSVREQKSRCRGRRSSFGACRGSSGFTLLELMMVVTVIGVVAAMSIPAYLKMQPHLRLKSAAKDVSNAINYARMTAISKNNNQTVSFDLGTDSFGYASVSSDDWKDVDIFDPDDVGAASIKADGGLVDDINSVTFRPDGTTTLLSDRQAIYLSNKRKPGSAWEYYKVEVEKNGIVRVKKFPPGGGSWVRG